MIRAPLRTANSEPRRRKISCSRDAGSLVLRCAVCADALSGSSLRELSDFHSPVRSEFDIAFLEVSTHVVHLCTQLLDILYEGQGTLSCI